jgi:hypothetical protein
VVAKDSAARGGNTSTTGWSAFTVDTGGGAGAEARAPLPMPSGPAEAPSRPPLDGCILRCRPSAGALGPATCAPAPSPPMAPPAGR